MNATQTISTGVTGPVLANGGSILVTGAGSIAGGAEGVFAENCSITTLTNKGSIGAAIGVPGGIGVLTNSGRTIGLLINANNATISGGAGASTLGFSGGAGGTGVANSGTITTLGNRGTISGGNGGASGLPPGAGGAGVSNAKGATISSLTNGGAIMGGAGGFADQINRTEGLGGAGIANAGTITTLTNSGTVRGGQGGGGIFGGSGGAGVVNSGAIMTLTNLGTIHGGHGGNSSFGGGSGVAGVMNEGTIASLSNRGAIVGGNGGNGVFSAGTGGAGVWNAGMIGSLANSGKVIGGAGGSGQNTSIVGAGGAGVVNSGTIQTLTNSGTIRGGNGGAIQADGPGGAGVANSGTIATLTSSGTISGGAGGSFGGAGGAGISNSGVIGPLANRGTIEGGLGTNGGAMGDAIHSVGLHASIGPITNSGQIIGNVVIDNQASVTVRGGTGTTFGSWVGGATNGGAITVGNGNLIFASGNTEVDEDIFVDGGLGTVTNDGALRFAASEVINGNFTNDGTVQVSSGKLEIDGAVTGAGKDTISGPSKLQFDAGVSTAAKLGHQDIDLSGTGGTMALLEPTDFYGKISDFGSGDTVKLENSWLFSALSHASGATTLTLESGTTKHAFEFAGDYSRSEFRITPGKITTITYA